jgi:hypothetical protein
MCSENMPPMRAPRPIAAFACLLATGLLVGGCGGGSSSTEGTGNGAGRDAESRPAPPKSDFPAPEGRSLEEVVNLADHPAQLGISPAAMVFYQGSNRYPFGVFEKGEGSASGKVGSEVTDAEVAIYYACVPPVKAGAKAKAGNTGLVAHQERRALEEPAIGPFPARIESLSPRPEFESATTSGNAATARVVYSAPLTLPARGECRPAALVKEGSELGAKLLVSVDASEFTEIPRAGEKPPAIHTPTAQDVDGDLAKITTRVPPDALNKVDFAEVLGKEPIVLLFATPKFCQSRVCGPVVDVAEEAQRKYAGQASFIHMEIYNENDPGEGVRPQVRAFHLPSEPWLFTFNREGRVSAAVEGAFGPELIDKDVEKAVGE